jgi:phytol kinase
VVILGISVIKIVFVLLLLWTVYLIVEIFRRSGKVHGELARKCIHIGVGLVLATLPVFMRRREILATNAVFLVGMIVFSGLLHWFKAYEDVRRWTLGQFFYPIGVSLVAVFFADPYVYSYAVLVLAISDGAAAIFGTAFGRKHYHLLGGDKTWIGSLAFFLTCATILATYVVLLGQISPLAIAMIPVAAWFLAGVEGVFAGGFDNLAVPVAAAFILQSF